MSSRYEKDHTFELGLDTMGSSDWNSPAAGSDADMMRRLQFASESVMRLATQTHSAVARGDTAAADAAHASMQFHLRMTTSLIDEMLAEGDEQHTLH